MATIVINNLDPQMVERFKAFARAQGVSLSVFSGATVTNNTLPAQSLHDALLNLPKDDDDSDIFARNYPQNDTHRDIDWSE